MNERARASADAIPLSGPLLQRKCACGGSCGDCARKLTVQRAVANGAHAPEYAPPIVHDALRSTGRSLDRETRTYMTSRFGHDFSRVRVHTDDTAARSAAAVGAEAYTVGPHIVFGGGRFSPATPEGKSLLAHELAHTVQQRMADVGAGPLPISTPGDAGEREAHHLAESAAAARPSSAPSGRGLQVARATRPFLLTFDDGPDGLNKLGSGNNRTENVLTTLCDRGIQAGFFVQTAARLTNEKTGKTFPGRGSTSIGETLIKRMSANGHMIGVHTGGTREHEDHRKALKAGRLATELGAAQTAIKTLTGKTPTLVRPPRGKFNPGVSAVYKSLGLTNVLWDIDGDQGASLPLPTLKQRVTDGINRVIANGWKGTTPLAPSTVVLYHDIQKNTSANVGTLIDFIKSETTALTSGKDTATFPSISCKSAASPAGAGSELEGPGDYNLPPGTEQSPEEYPGAPSDEERLA